MKVEMSESEKCLARILDASANYAVQHPGANANYIVCTDAFLRKLLMGHSLLEIARGGVSYDNGKCELFGMRVIVGDTGGFDFVIGEMLTYEEIRRNGNYHKFYSF